MSERPGRAALTTYRQAGQRHGAEARLRGENQADHVQALTLLQRAHRSESTALEAEVLTVRIEADLLRVPTGAATRPEAVNGDGGR